MPKAGFCRGGKTLFIFTKEIPNGKHHFLCIDLCKQIDGNYCEEENNLFFEKLCCFFINIFWKKSLQSENFLPLGV